MFVLSMSNSAVKKIGIIGCGWLGLPLAVELNASGYKINGSTTTPGKLSLLAQKNITPFLINLAHTDNKDQIQQFLDVDLLIVNVPPGRAATATESYLDKMKFLKSEIIASSIKKLIFISSTSVYAENNAGQTENSTDFAVSNAAVRMRSAELLFSDLPNISTTVIRMGGLINAERHPGRFFAGKTDIPNGLAPVNLIHLDDCIGIIKKVITADLWGDIFNAVAPIHPAKMEFYDLASKKLHGKPADFIAEKGNFKIIDSEKVRSKGYQFIHLNLMEWLQKS